MRRRDFLVGGVATSALTSGARAMPAWRVPAVMSPIHRPAAFNPASLFGPTDRGIAIDFTNPSNLFQGSGGTTAVASPGDPIGYAKDLGTNSKPAIQATTTKRPLWMGSPRTLGAELVSNGRMVSDASGWTLGGGWAWSASGKITKTAGSATNLSWPVSLVVGTAYALFFSAQRSAGTVTPKITGGTTISFPARSASATGYEIFIAQSGNTTLEFDADAAFAGSIGLVSLKPVTSWTNMGSYSDGVDDMLATAAIDMTGSHQGTMVIAGYWGWRTSSQVLFDVGSYESSVGGSFEGLFNGSALSRFANGTALNSVTDTDFPVANFSGTAPAFFVRSYLVDFTQASVAGQMSVRSRGLLPTQTPTTNTVANHALPNAAISLHSAPSSVLPWFGALYFTFLINRALNAQELASVEARAKRGMVYACFMGDSTGAADDPTAAAGLNKNFPIPAFVGGMVTGSANYAYPGDKIADQKTKLVNGGSANLLGVQVGVILVGLNDVNTYIGAGTKTTAQIITEYQNLVDTFNLLKPAGCKTYICGMTPAKAWLGAVTGNPAACYQAWLDVNAALAGAPNPGFNAITGVDARIMGHVAALNDGSGNLAQAFNGNYDNVHESTEGRFVIGALNIRPQLEADNLLLTA